MQMSAAMSSDRSTISRADSCVFSNSARAADCANGPPEPMAASGMLGLDDIAIAGDHVQAVRIAHQQQRLEAAQVAVGAPVLGQLDGGAREVAEFLQLALEALEQREGVGRAAGEAGQHLAVVQPAHLAGIALHHGVAQGDLAVAAEGEDAVAAHRKDGGAVGIEVARLIRGSPRAMGQPATAAGARMRTLRKCGRGAGNQGGCRSAWC